MLKVYMGWDARESAAYSVAEFSIMRRTSEPVRIEALRLASLVHSGMLTRPIERRGGSLFCPISDAPMATEFAISRFCVPLLQKEGWALFMDCDMLVMDDIAKLFAMRDDKYAVMVVKHDHKPTEDIKMDGQRQTAYARKNWSSFILWNCSHPANDALDHKMINSVAGLALHQFRWLDDGEIGELPGRWNWLAGVHRWTGEHPSNIHYTLGGPWFPHWQKTEFDHLWLAEKAIMDEWYAARPRQ